MAGDVSTTREQAGGQPAPRRGRVVAYDTYIDGRLQTTRRQIKAIEVATRLVALLAAVLMFLLTVALLDHWVFPEGLGLTGRLIAFLLLVIGGSVYFVWGVLPLLLRRVNTVYAAQAIEHTEPSLKNSLINFLLLRSHRRELTPVIYQALERRAATDLHVVAPSAAVDRTPLVRTAYVLAAVVALFCAYLVLSPKNPLRSLGRVMAPWSDIQAPTRVTILDVQPGTTRAFHDDTLTVTAEVRGVRDGEPVHLYYSTDDGQIVERAIAMELPEDGYRYRGPLPQGSAGLRQSVRYWIAAGDARSADYRIEVISAPAILVDRVEYRYPQYTGVEPRVGEHQGDLRAVEGTHVTLSARANCGIQSAWLDLGSDGRRNRALEIQDRTGQVSFTLSLDDKGRSPHDSYQIRFTTPEGIENPRPIRYSIEVVPDEPPQISFLAPESEEVEVPLDGAEDLIVRAIDPDFGLRNVVLRVEGREKSLVDEPLLDKLHAGAFRGGLRFEPAKLGLAVGDQVTYWATAEDNRQPTPGRAETSKRVLRITAPTGAERPQDQLAKADPPEEVPDEEPEQQQPPQPQAADGEGEGAAGGEGDEPMEQPADSGDGESDGEGEGGTQREDGKGEQPNKRIDPMTNPGDAFEKILQHREQASQDGQGEGDGEGPRDQPQDSPDRRPDDAPMDESQERQPPSDQADAESQRTPDQTGRHDELPDDAQRDPSPSGQPSAGEQDAGETGDMGGRAQGEGSDEGDATPQPGSGGADPSDDPGTSAADGQHAEDDPVTDDTASAGEGTQRGRPGDKDDPGATAEEMRAEFDGEAQDAPGEGQRADTPDGMHETDESKESGDPPDGSEDGDAADTRGDSGAGIKPDQKQGSPAPQKDNRPREKQRRPDDLGEQTDGEQPTSPSQSDHQSDTEGGQRGDQSGGGGEGGGQKADLEGTGAAGSNTAAEQGGGAAEGPGDGPTSDRGGADVPGGEPSGGESKQQVGTGRDAPAGKPESGPGQKQPPIPPDSRDSGGQDRPSDGSGGEQTSQPSDPTSDPTGGETQGTDRASGDAGGREGDGGAEPGSGSPRGGGPTGGDRRGDPQPSDDEPGGDDPNLQYANQATDLALDYLKDQLGKDQPDRELLDKLQWTREDMQRFVEHWERLKQEAADADDAQKRLNRALDALGLRPRGTALRSQPGRTEQIDRTRDARRSQPPAEYAEQFKAYTEGTSRSRTPRDSAP